MESLAHVLAVVFYAAGAAYYVTALILLARRAKQRE
jgi:hypothetical protein